MKKTAPFLPSNALREKGQRRTAPVPGMSQSVTCLPCAPEDGNVPEGRRAAGKAHPQMQAAVSWLEGRSAGGTAGILTASAGRQDGQGAGRTGGGRRIRALAGGGKAGREREEKEADAATAGLAPARGPGAGRGAGPRIGPEPERRGGGKAGRDGSGQGSVAASGMGQGRGMSGGLVVCRHNGAAARTRKRKKGLRFRKP